MAERQRKAMERMRPMTPYLAREGGINVDDKLKRKIKKTFKDTKKAIKSYLAAMKHYEDNLRDMMGKMDDLADEVDRHIMKKTTQESPEWRGRANCRAR